MISSPNQWQIDSASDKDRIEVYKKSIISYIVDFLTQYKPVYVKVNYKGKLKLVDNRFVVIFSAEDLSSSMTSETQFSISSVSNLSNNYMFEKSFLKFY